MRLPKSKTVFGTAATALVLLGGLATTYGATFKTVTVQDSGQRKILRGFGTGSVDDFLKKYGIHVTKRDRVSPALNTPVKNGENVDIVSPKLITVDYEGKLEKASTFDGTVGRFLKDQGVKLTSSTHVNVPTTAKLSDGETISIHISTQKRSTVTRKIPFQTIRRSTVDLTTGHERDVTHGVKGLLRIQTTSVYRDGHKVSQSVSKKVVRKPVDAVVEVGTATAVHHYTLSSRSDVPNQSLISGSMTVLATAYTAGGYTATGRPATPGVIAVDPSVIPLGSRVYIPGVGIEVAADTGGAIIGHHIDICMSSEAAAVAWGERTITIYLIH